MYVYLYVYICIIYIHAHRNIDQLTCSCYYQLRLLRTLSSCSTHHIASSFIQKKRYDRPHRRERQLYYKIKDKRN